ncbi:MAG: DUF3991 and toprim domain-containing protein [Oscillospiraceae bacterium]|jgi:hypothetical protein|nr:DUF3991 and toprim domain-containing protein [Oscillospiraceae bacterium]
MSIAKTEYYTAEEYEAAKSADIAAFLMSIGCELTRVGCCWKGKRHDSLVIRDDGRWYWNSRGLHGHSPIELYKQILLSDYGYPDEITAAIAAVKALAGGRGISAESSASFVSAAPRSARERTETESLPLPATHKNNNRVMAYLCKTRGLDPDIVRGLMKSGKLYETVQRWDKGAGRYVDGVYHNAVFVAYDSRGRPRNAFLRGTISTTDKPFKSDVQGSDKSYPFTVPELPGSNTVFCFESAVDAISHAGIYKRGDADWRDGHRISLGGTSFQGLDRFLSEHPDVTNIVSCLDSDETGERRSRKLADEYSAKGYVVEREAPIHKDFNEDLLDYLQEEQEETEDEFDYESLL